MPKNNKKTNPSFTERLNELSQIMGTENLQELEVTDEGFHVKLVRRSRENVVSHPVFHASAPTSLSSPKKEVKGKAQEVEGTPVPAPIAGVFYRSPSPSSPSFVKEGDVVAPGKALCIIEAMKVMNEITSPSAGRVIKILVENGKPVEANQTLFILGPVE